MPHPMQAARLAQSHKLATRAEHMKSDTNFTTEECKCLLIFHQRLTRNGNLDRSRFREVLQIVFDITDDVMLDLVFRACDTDNDGIVSDLEFVKGLSVMIRGSLEQLIEFTYDVYDMNGDGSLAREELSHCLKGCMHGGFGLDDDEVDECERDIIEIAMRKLDVNHDGQITFDDFVNAVKADPLLLQACGPCLPACHSSAAFLALITDRYRSYSNIYPGMPLAAGHGKSKKSILKKLKAKRVSTTSLQSSSSSLTVSEKSNRSLLKLPNMKSDDFARASLAIVAQKKANRPTNETNAVMKVGVAPLPKRLTNAAQEAFNYRMKIEMAELDGSNKSKPDKRMIEIMHAGACTEEPKKKKAVARHPEKGNKNCKEGKDKRGGKDNNKGAKKDKGKNKGGKKDKDKADTCELDYNKKKKLEEEKKKKKLEEEKKKKKKEAERQEAESVKKVRKIGQPNSRLYNPTPRPMFVC